MEKIETITELSKKDYSQFKNNKLEKKEKNHIVYKSLENLPKENPTTTLCDFFLTNRMRFCKFAKMVNYKYCQHHNAELLISCKNCGHKIYEENSKKHEKVCKTIKEKERFTSYILLYCKALKCFILILFQ